MFSMGFGAKETVFSEEKQRNREVDSSAMLGKSMRAKLVLFGWQPYF